MCLCAKFTVPDKIKKMEFYAKVDSSAYKAPDSTFAYFRAVSTRRVLTRTRHVLTRICAYKVKKGSTTHNRRNIYKTHLKKCIQNTLEQAVLEIFNFEKSSDVIG